MSDARYCVVVEIVGLPRLRTDPMTWNEAVDARRLIALAAGPVELTSADVERVDD